MTAYAFETWDVFTGTRFAGNPLAILSDASGLGVEAMQAITREFNLAETVFIFPPDDAAHTARLRIFTPGYEMPFAGHPTVGAAISLAEARRLDGPLLLELNAGLFPVRIERRGALLFAEFENPNPPKDRGAVPEAGLIEAALSLAPGEINRDHHRPRRVGAAVDFIYARAPLAAVRRAAFNAAAWPKLALDRVVGVLLYAEGGDAADASYHVRMFAPDAGIVEDPATGSAACALPGQIALSQALADGRHDWIIEQGAELGRPSRIHASADARNGEIISVRIGGTATPVSKGHIFV